MLKGVYSHINPVSKLILLLLLVFGFLLLSLLFGIVALVPFYGTSALSLITSADLANPSVVNAMKVIQLFNSAGGMMLPAAIFVWLFTPKDSKSIFNGSVNVLIIASTLLLALVAQPVVGLANELNSYMILPHWLNGTEQWMKDMELKSGQITDAFLSTTSIGGLLANILIIAILPALAEEFLFRGALAKLIRDWTRNTHVAVILSSLIFAAIHLQFYGFLPRFLMGVALAYLFFWSGSLWLPILAHFTNNFLSVIVEFLFRKGLIGTNAENFGMKNAAWLTLASLVLVTALLYYIRKSTSLKSAETTIVNPEY
jgi:uncharacterized protein